MNLLYTLNEEIENKHLNTDEKIRYIYLRLCQIFSFDTRWYYAYFLSGYKTYLEIKNKKFNVKNIQEYEVICHTIVPYIMEPLYKELLGIDLEVFSTDSHTYAVTNFDGEEYRLDLTGENDFTYVKMGLMTKGFKPLCYAHEREQVLYDMDKSLGFNLLSLKEYKDKLNINPNITLFEKKIAIANLLENSVCKYHYSDARNFLNKIDDIIEVSKEQDDATFVSDAYDFYHLYHLNSEDKYLELSKSEDEYKLKEIDEERYSTLKCKLYSRY